MNAGELTPILFFPYLIVWPSRMARLPLFRELIQTHRFKLSLHTSVAVRMQSQSTETFHCLSANECILRCLHVYIIMLTAVFCVLSSFLVKDERIHELITSVRGGGCVKGFRTAKPNRFQQKLSVFQSTNVLCKFHL